MKPLARFATIALVAIAASSPFIPPTQAFVPGVQLGDSSLQTARRLRRYRFRVRASGYRRGGFSRSPGCPKNVDVTALTPTRDEDGTSLGNDAATYLTASEHPTFFVHLPTLPATTGKLTIQNNDPSLPLTQRQIYETDFEITGQSGILGIRVPATAAALQLGNTYSWQISVICPADVTDDVTINDQTGSMAYFGGIIERVADTPGSPTDRLDFYLNEGIWQESLLLTLEAYQNNPGDSSTQTQWSTLMTDVGLEQFTTQPFLGIVNGQ
ncbi:MAG: DUF928 domain-containing protein [Cyanobacteria bacterium J06642_11]